jgi:GT2 family glycosyltransferase
MAGYQLAIAKNTFVYHHGSATFKESQLSHHQWMEVNRSRFYEKVGRIATTIPPRSPASPECSKTVSVIVRTQDRPKLLENALASLSHQTFHQFEVIIVNDGGEDPSEQVRKFERYFPINYIYHDKPLGRTHAINEGIRVSEGEWISFLDDDDVLYPWHLETLFRAAESFGVKVVYSDFNRALFADSETTFPIRIMGAPPWEFNLDELLVQNFIPIHSWLHHRECFQEVGHWDEGLDRLEDYDYLLRLGSKYTFHHVSKVTCEYRYYLDVANTITSGRTRYLDALKKIYQKFPAEDSDLRHEREKVLDRISEQVKTIQIFEQTSNGSPEDEARVNRKIIELVAGL